MLAVVGNVAFGIEAGEDGVAHAARASSTPMKAAPGSMAAITVRFRAGLEVLPKGGAVAFAARAAGIGPRTPFGPTSPAQSSLSLAR